MIINVAPTIIAIYGLIIGVWICVAGMLYAAITRRNFSLFIVGFIAAVILTIFAFGAIDYIKGV